MKLEIIKHKNKPNAESAVWKTGDWAETIKATEERIVGKAEKFCQEKYQDGEGKQILRVRVWCVTIYVRVELVQWRVQGFSHVGDANAKGAICDAPFRSANVLPQSIYWLGCVSFCERFFKILNKCNCQETSTFGAGIWIH